MSPADAPPADDLDPYIGAIGSTPASAIQMDQQDKERRRRFNVTANTALDYFSEPDRFQQSPHATSGDLGIKNYAQQAGDQFESLLRSRAPEYANQVPQARQKFEAQLFAAQQKAKLDYWRQQYANADETTLGTIRRLSIPGAARVTRIQFAKNAKAADAAIQAGTANEDAYRELAAIERLAKLSEDHPFKEAVFGLPAVVGEYAAGGKVLGALGKVTPGLGWLAPEAAAPASLLGRGAVAVGRGIGLTATVPGGAIEAAQQRAIATGGSLTDLKNLGPALAHETLQNAVFGSLADVANVPGGTFANRLQRIAAKTGVGIAEQQAIDVIGKATGLQTRYGVLQDLLEGKGGDALQHLGVQALTFGALSALHSGDPEAVLKAHAKALDQAKQQGLSPDGAANLLAPVYRTVNDALAAHQDAKKAVDDTLSNPIQRELGRALAEPLRLAYRAPETPAPFAPDVTQPLRAGVPGQLLETGGPERLVGPFERLAPDEVVQLAKQLTGKALTTPQALVKELARRGLSAEGINQLSEATSRAPEIPTPAPAAPESLPGPEVAAKAPEPAPAAEAAPSETPGPPVVHYPEYDPNHPLWKPPPEEEAPHPAALAFQRSFPGMEVTSSGQLRATVGEGEHARDVFLREGETPDTVRLDFTHTQAELKAQPSGKLEPGTLELTKGLLRFAGELKGTGTGLEYVAKRGLSEKYAKALDRAGWEQVSGPTGEGTGLRVWRPKVIQLDQPQTPTPTVQELTQQLASGRAVDPEQALASANLNAKEKHVLRERFAGRAHEDIAGDPEMAKRGGGKLTRERVRQIETAALRKFGIERSLEEQGAPLAEQNATALDRIEDGKRVAPEELHHDPESVRPVVQRRGDARFDAADAIDELTTRMLQEAEDHGGRLSAERQRYYADEATRLHARAGTAEPSEGPETPELRGQPAGRPGQAPVRPAPGGAVPGGTAPLEGGAAGAGTPAQPGQAAGPAAELPREAAPAEAAAAPGRPARGYQLAAARAAKSRSVLSVIKGWGGLSEKGAEALGLDVPAAKESLLTIFKDAKGKPGKLDLEDLLREAEAQGWIRDAKSPKAGEELLGKILDRVQVEDAGLEAELRHSEAAYLKEKEDAVRQAQAAGHSAASAQEAVRSGESAGHEEGADRSRTEEAPDVHAEYVEGQEAPGATEFAFGANELGGAAAGAAPTPEPGAGEPGRRVAGTAPLRPEPRDPIADVAGQLAAEEAGHVNVSRLGEVARAFGRQVSGTLRYLRDGIARISGKMFPATTRLDRESGEKVAELAVAGTYARQAAEHYADLVLGEGSTQDFDRRVGGVLMEQRARFARQAFLREAAIAANKGDKNLAAEYQDKAGQVITFIGGDNSPFKTEADYQAVLHDPQVQQAVRRYSELFAKPIKEPLFRKTQGMDPDEQIDSLTQIPDSPIRAFALQPDADSPTVAAGAGRGNLKNLRLKRNPAAQPAALSADAYELDLRRIIEQDLARTVPLAAKAEAMRVMEANGVARWGKPGQKQEGETEFPFANPPRGTQEAKPGQTSFYVKDEAASEWRDAINVDRVHPAIKGLSALNYLPTVASVASTVEPATHGVNLLGSIFAPRVIRGLFKSVYQRLFDKPAYRQNLLDLAEIGAEKPSGPETGSLAQLLLPERLQKPLAKYDPTYWTGRLLDGISNIMRSALGHAYDSLAESGHVPDTDTGKRDFINGWVGQYEKKAQNGVIRFLRDSKIGPFATAASQMTARGVRMLAASHGAEASSLRSDLIMRAEVFAKLAAVVGGIAAMNYAQWGRWDGDDKTPFLALKTGEGKYLDLSAITGLKRGMRAVPMLSYLVERERGVLPEAKTEDKVYDAVHSLLHPALGPGVQFTHTAVTGKNIFGANVAAQTSKATTPRGIRAAEKAGKPLSGQPWENLKAAVLNANPPVGSMTGAYTSRPTGLEDRFWHLLGSLGPKELPPEKGRVLR